VAMISRIRQRSRFIFWSPLLGKILVNYISILWFGKPGGRHFRKKANKIAFPCRSASDPSDNASVLSYNFRQRGKLCEHN
jgi:hypothetical protein